MRFASKTLIVAVISAGSLATATAFGQRLEGLWRDRSPITALTFSPKGDALVSGHADGQVKLWKVGVAGESRTVGRHLRMVDAVAVSPDGRAVASAGREEAVLLWNLEDATEFHAMEGFSGRAYDMAFSRQASRLAAAGGVFATPGQVRLWDLADPSDVREIEGLAERARAVAFSPDGAMLAAAGGRLPTAGEIRVWKMADPSQPTLAVRLRAEVLDVAFSPDGKTLAAGVRDGTVRLFDPVEGKTGPVLLGHTADVFFVGYGGGRVLVSAGLDNTVRFWDAADGRPFGRLYDPLGQRRDGRVYAVALSQNGRRLATGSLGGVIKLWSIDETPPHGRTPLYPTRWAKRHSTPNPVRPALPQ